MKSRQPCLGAAAGALLFIIAAAAPASAQTAPASPPAEASDAREREALALVQLMQPPGQLIDTVIAVLDRDMVRTLQTGPVFQEIERSTPGFLQAYWAEVRPVMARALSDRIPHYHQQLSRLYAERLTEAELRSARAFFSGEIGQKMVALIHQNADFSPMMAEVARNPSAEISESSYDASVETTSRAAFAGLTEKEKAAMTAFGLSPVGRKLTALGPESDRLADESFNAEDPALDARMDSIRDDVLARLSAGKKRT